MKTSTWYIKDDDLTKKTKKGPIPSRLRAELDCLSFLITYSFEFGDIATAERELHNYNEAFSRWFFDTDKKGGIRA